MHRAIGRSQFANGTDETAGRTHFGWRHSHDGVGTLLALGCGNLHVHCPNTCNRGWDGIPAV